MIDMKKSFDPEKYDMVICPLCNGDGELAEDPGGGNVCANCGGFGMIKNEKEGSPGKQIEFRGKSFLLP
jgi:DnaJ-class molecular chaperone